MTRFLLVVLLALISLVARAVMGLLFIVISFAVAVLSVFFAVICWIFAKPKPLDGSHVPNQ